MSSLLNTLSVGVLALLNNAAVFLGRDEPSAESPPGDGPGYNPQFWTDSYTRQVSNNCYNYAVNRATDSFATPGGPDGLEHIWPLDCKSVTDAAMADGLQPISSGAAPCDGHRVFLGVHANDFHWWRQDGPKFWTHKPGMTPPVDVDDNGDKIEDPLKANLGPYEACDFFCVEDEKVMIS